MNSVKWLLGERVLLLTPEDDDYTKLKFLEGMNRDVEKHPSHLKRLNETIPYNTVINIDCVPITENTTLKGTDSGFEPGFYIADGQFRYTICLMRYEDWQKGEGARPNDIMVNIYHFSSLEKIGEFITQLNNIRRSWTTSDYVNLGVALKLQAYKLMRKLWNKSQLFHQSLLPMLIAYIRSRQTADNLFKHMLMRQALPSNLIEKIHSYIVSLSDYERFADNAVLVLNLVGKKKKVERYHNEAILDMILSNANFDMEKFRRNMKSAMTAQIPYQLPLEKHTKKEFELIYNGDFIGLGHYKGTTRKQLGDEDPKPSKDCLNFVMDNYL